MVRRSRGPRSKTRYKLKKEIRQKGNPSVSSIMKVFNVGDKVIVRVNPSVEKGRPSLRFHGLSGKITDKRGRCYIVELYEGNKKKEIISSALHLRIV